MISFFPDLNVWVALSVSSHIHSAEAWRWLNAVPGTSRLIFARYTHIGLLRLLSTASVMGKQTLTLRKAWRVYDQWLSDPRVEFYPEPRGIELVFREATAPFAAKAAPKWLGGCYLLAYAKESGATLVTFDKALLDYAQKNGCAVIAPA